MKVGCLAVLSCVLACRAAALPPVVVPAPRATPRADVSAAPPRDDANATDWPVFDSTEPFPADAPFRLPHTFEPTRYRVRLSIEDRRVDGHIEIEGDLAEPVSLIWLDAVDLRITHAKATSGETVVPLAFSPPRHDQVLGLRSKSPLTPGHWTIAIEYSAPIREQEPPVKSRYGGPGEDPPALGVFRRGVGMSSYIFTQSEPIAARKIFPCIDEPDRKVPWQLTLDVAKDLVAASNTPIVRETPIGNGRKRVEFAQTRPLPSYLIAFAVGPFDIVDAGKATSGTPIRILAIRGRAAAVASAAKATPRILDALEAWLGIPYAYGKLDLVDVPHLGFGAMENPGLVTVTQTALEQAGDTSTITHELAHQWFGNLVTLGWWDDIWLNESFAEFMEAKIEAQLAGETGVVDPATAHEEVLELDKRSATRRHVVTLDDLDARKFADWFAMSSGATFLEGVEVSLGPERFQKALHAYLTAHADGTVATANLMHAFAGAAGLPLEAALTHLLDGNVISLKPHELCTGNPRLHFAATTEPIHVCVAYDRDGKRAESCAMLDNKIVGSPGTELEFAL